MEKPDAIEKNKNLTPLRLNQLLHHLISLPTELVLSILYQIDYPTLSLLCFEIKRRSVNNSLNPLGFYCDDANFWRDYILQEGFIFPEDMPKLVKFLNHPTSTDAIFLRQLFLSENPKDQKYAQGRLIKIWKNDEKYHDVPVNPFRQMILDFDYIWRQIEDYRWRKRNRKPQVYEIDFQERLNFATMDGVITHLLNGINSLTYSDFLEFLVENDVKLMPKIYTLISSWIKDYLELDRNYYRKDSPLSYLLDELEEQSLVLIDNTLHEGDLLVINLDYSQENYDEPIVYSQFYFYFDGQKLIQLPKYFISRYLGLLPEEAVPFLIKRNISTLKDLHRLYLLEERDYLTGFLYQDKIYLLSDPDSDDKLTISGHTFYV